MGSQIDFREGKNPSALPYALELAVQFALMLFALMFSLSPGPTIRCKWLTGEGDVDFVLLPFCQCDKRAYIHRVR